MESSASVGIFSLVMLPTNGRERARGFRRGMNGMPKCLLARSKCLAERAKRSVKSLVINHRSALKRFANKLYAYELRGIGMQECCREQCRGGCVRDEQANDLETTSLATGNKRDTMGVCNVTWILDGSKYLTFADGDDAGQR